MMINVLSITIGLIFLYLGGEGLIRSTVTIAEKVNLSTLTISTIFIGFGTSIPELLVSLDASLEGYPEIALGNVIGSNISNTFLVLGMAAMIASVPCQTRQVKYNALFGMLASIGLVILSLLGYIHRFTGFVLIVCLIVYITLTIWKEKSRKTESKKIEEKIENQIERELEYKRKTMAFAVLITILSLFLLPIGAHLLIHGAVSIANYFNISKAVIGLTLVAIGTSLPEIATAIIASIHKHPDMIIGNILGSNLFNILFIIGMVALITPIPIKGELIQQSIWIMMGAAAMLLFVIFKKNKISHQAGLVFTSLYFIYVFCLYLIN